MQLRFEKIRSRSCAERLTEGYPRRTRRVVHLTCASYPGTCAGEIRSGRELPSQILLKTADRELNLMLAQGVLRSRLRDTSLRFLFPPQSWKKYHTVQQVEIVTFQVVSVACVRSPRGFGERL